ncbi:type I-C CRISPR-associated protein Cas8c/Csd1, partial [Rhodomicrobium sp. R_RK_3]
MSVLASLVRAYDRMADRHEVPPFGYSSEEIGFVISLNEDGTSAGLPIDVRATAGKRLRGRRLSVPASFKRPGITPRAFFLWDNTAFALGVSAKEGKDAASRFQAFLELHARALRDADDPGLKAFLRFIEAWRPEDFLRLGWPDEMKDLNVVFALNSERLSGINIHDRPAARSLWARLLADGDKSKAVCMISGDDAPVARLHPAIKSVWGAQIAGASIVSFNLEASESYCHVQGDNAPVSEAAAFAYTAALNKFLETGSRNRIQIGDASTVFWADASCVDADPTSIAEDAFLAMFNGIDESADGQKVGAILAKIRNGERLEDFAPGLAKGVRFHVLGLAPNAARLSVRFWLEDEFGRLAENYRRFADDMTIEPPPRGGNPPLWRFLAETACQSAPNFDPQSACKIDPCPARFFAC